MTKTECIALMAAIGDSYTRDFGFQTNEELVSYLADIYELAEKEVVKRKVKK